MDFNLRTVHGQEFIYGIRHRKTGKMYVGRTTNSISGRLSQHIFDLRSHRHSVEDMQSDFDTYGEDYEFYILDVVDTDYIDKQGAEKKYMRKYATYDRSKGYNYKDPMAKTIIKEICAEMESDVTNEELLAMNPLEMDKQAFKAEMKKQLTLKQWDYSDLAVAAGYTHGTIKTMMCDEDKLTPQAIKKFAEVLGIGTIEESSSSACDSVGTRVAMARASAGMTQEELASIVGYENRSSIARIENNTVDIPLEKMVLIADALNTTVASLIGEAHHV